MIDECSPHLTTEQVRGLAGKIDTAEGQASRDLMTRLAWRPAWAIRSRRGAPAVMREMVRGLIRPKTSSRT